MTLRRLRPLITQAHPRWPMPEGYIICGKLTKVEFVSLFVIQCLQATTVTMTVAAPSPAPSSSTTLLCVHMCVCVCVCVFKRMS